MKKKLALILLSLLLLLSGCWDSIEIEDEFLVLAMGWEKAEDPDKMILSLTSPTTAEGAPELVSVITVAAYSVEAGIRQAKEITYRNVELGHMRILLVGEEFAKMGIQKHLDSIGRNPRIGRGTLIAVIGEPLYDVWNIENPSTPRPSEYIVKMIRTNQDVNLALASTFRSFFTKLGLEGAEPTTAYLTLTEDKKSINSNGAAVFLGDKLVGKLLGNELEALLLLTGESKSGAITLGRATVGPDEDATTFMYHRSETKVKTRILGDEPHVYVSITLEGDITEYTSAEPTRDEAVIAKIEQALANVEGDIINDTIRKCQKEYRSDVFGFGEYFRAYHSSWWNEHNWNEEFPTAKVHVEVEAKIRRIGIES